MGELTAPRGGPGDECGGKAQPFLGPQDGGLRGQQAAGVTAVPCAREGAGSRGASASSRCVDEGEVGGVSEQPSPPSAHRARGPGREPHVLELGEPCATPDPTPLAQPCWNGNPADEKCPVSPRLVPQ